MELRHLRYFVAVAEAGSMTVAAEQRLHTAQPSLSRQIRDLEEQVGTPLLVRGARGIDLTAAGRVFLDHARMVLAQVEVAAEAARRAAQPARGSFALGFLTGQEMDWLPGAMQLLRDKLPEIEVTVSSQYSPELALALQKGRLDAAFMRAEPGLPELEFRRVAREHLLVVLPSDHALAAQERIEPAQLAGETFVHVSATAPVLRTVIDDWLRSHGLAQRQAQEPGQKPVQAHEADNLAMAISLVASTRGVALLPDYARNFLPGSVVARPLAEAEPPGIDLVLGYRRANPSPLLAILLSRLDELVCRFGMRPGA